MKVIILLFPISDEFIWWCILTEFLTFFLCCLQFWQPTIYIIFDFTEFFFSFWCFSINLISRNFFNYYDDDNCFNFLFHGIFDVFSLLSSVLTANTHCFVLQRRKQDEQGMPMVPSQQIQPIRKRLWHIRPIGKHLWFRCIRYTTALICLQSKIHVI